MNYKDVHTNLQCLKELRLRQGHHKFTLRAYPQGYAFSECQEGCNLSLNGDLDEAEALSSTVDSNNITYAIIPNNCDHNMLVKVDCRCEKFREVEMIDIK